MCRLSALVFLILYTRPGLDKIVLRTVRIFL